MKLISIALIVPCRILVNVKPFLDKHRKHLKIYNQSTQLLVKNIHFDLVFQPQIESV